MIDIVRRREIIGTWELYLGVVIERVDLLKKNAPSQKIFEIIYRHEIEKGDDFRMEPGFKNFEKIQKGQLLATSNVREIKSEWDAYLFVPIHQSQCNDGFFIIEEQ